MKTSMLLFDPISIMGQGNVNYSLLILNLFVSFFGGELVGEELKTAPRGFDKEHPNLDLIRKKGFIAHTAVDDLFRIGTTAPGRSFAWSRPA